MILGLICAMGSGVVSQLQLSISNRSLPLIHAGSTAHEYCFWESGWDFEPVFNAGINLRQAGFPANNKSKQVLNTPIPAWT